MYCDIAYNTLVTCEKDIHTFDKHIIKTDKKLYEILIVPNYNWKSIKENLKKEKPQWSI